MLEDGPMARVRWFFHRFESDLALLLIPVLWGVTFPLIRTALLDVDPHTFVALRFAIAGAAIAPLIFFSKKLRQEFWAAMPWGLGLAVLLFVVFLSQTVGLKTVPSARGAFITGASVLLVPLLSPLFKRGFPSIADWIGSFIAVLGLYVLIEPESGGVTRGDLFVFLSATAIAFHMHCLQIACRKSFSDVILVYWQTIGVAFFATISVPLTVGKYSAVSGRAFTSMAICALIVSLGTFYLQTRYQKRTTPEHAALVFALEPVFATLFGFILLGEVLTYRGFAGAGIMLCALMGTSILARYFSLKKRARTANSSFPLEAQSIRSLP